VVYNRVIRDHEDEQLPKGPDVAEFIVTACNSHHELVGALENAKINLEEYRAGGVMQGWDLTLKNANKALSKAKGETQ